MIPKKTIARLSVYKRVLQTLRESGVEQISSKALGNILNIKASQIRKDFSYLGGLGRRKIGYDISSLILGLTQILCADEPRPVVLVGVGNLGRALMSYKGFIKDGMQITAAFDMDSKKSVGLSGGIPVYNMEKMKDYMKRRRIKIALLCVPAQAAQRVADSLIQSGILGILNFAPVPIEVPSKITVSYVNLATELERLIYTVSATQLK